MRSESTIPAVRSPAVGGRPSCRRQRQAGEVRLRHHAVGLNFIDTYHRSGLYPLSLLSGLGMEGAGVVEAVGEGVARLRAGDRVAYTSGPARCLCRGAQHRGAPWCRCRTTSLLRGGARR